MWPGIRRTGSLSTAVVVALALAASATPGVAAETTLTDVLASTYRENPDLAAARARLRATDETLGQALAGYWRPNVSMGLEHERGRARVNQTESVLTPGKEVYRDGQTTLSVEAELPLYRGGRTLAAIREAESRIRAEQAVLVSTEQTVLATAAKHYVDILYYQDTLAIYEDEVAELGRLVRYTRDLLASHRGTVVTVAEVEADLAQAEANRIDVAALLAQAAQRFRTYTGLTAAGLSRAVRLPEVPDGREQVVTLALEANPDIRSVREQVRASEATEDQARGALLPQVSAVASYQRSTTDTKYTNPPGYKDDSRTADLTVGLRLSMPLYEGGLALAQTRQMRQTTAALRNQVRSTGDGVENAAVAAWEQRRAAGLRLDGGRERLRSARAALDGVYREFTQGLRTVQDVLTQRTKLYQARQDQVTAEHDQRTATIDLLTALGRFTAPALALPVETYDPARHLEQVRNRILGLF